MKFTVHRHLNRATRLARSMGAVVVFVLALLLFPLTVPPLFAQTEPTVEDEIRLLYDFQQVDAGNAVTPSTRACPSASVSEGRQLDSGLGQRNMALKATVLLSEPSARCWGGVWFDLADLDMSAFNEFSFDIKGMVTDGFPEVIRVELKKKLDDTGDPFAIAVYEVAGIGPEWQSVHIPLEDFVPIGTEPALESWEDVDQLVFMVDSQLTNGGTFYLDNIALRTETAGPVMKPAAQQISQVPSMMLASFEHQYPVDATINESNTVTVTTVADDETGSIIALIEYDTPTDWASFDVVLDATNISAYDAVSFFARTTGEDGAEPELAIYFQSNAFRLAGPNTAPGYRMAQTQITGDQWQKYTIPLSVFSGNVEDDAFWTSLDRLMFVFTPELSGESGAVFIDNIEFERLAVQTSDLETDAGALPVIEDQIPAVEEDNDEPAMPDTEIDDGKNNQAATEAVEDDSPVAEPLQPPAPAESVRLLVSDFDHCHARDSGGAYNAPTTVTDTYPTVNGRGCTLKVDFDTDSWAAYYFLLGPADLSGFDKVAFDMAFENGGPGTRLKVELKESDEVLSIFYIDNPPPTWQTMSIPLSSFYDAPYGRHLSSWESIKDLVFTVESTGNTIQPTLYLDNVYFSQNDPQ